jgi:glycosyltransferase involved in cell wall biosynthesis
MNNIVTGKPPFFSVVIPTYNMSEWIPYAIESVLNQSFNDFELLIQDNASNDKTKYVVEKYRDSRISYEVNPSNVGMFGNLNLVCSRAKGKYIKILCADDTLSPVCLEVIYSILNNNIGESYKIVSVNGSSHEPSLDICRQVDERKKRVIDRNNLFSFLYEPDNWGAGLSSVCIENMFFRSEGFFGETNAEKDFSKDIIVFFFLVIKSPALLLDKKLVYGRSHSNQNRYILRYINQLNEIFHFFEQCISLGYDKLPFFEMGRIAYLDDYLVRHYFYGIKSFFKTGSFLYITEVISLQKQHKYFRIPFYSLLLKIAKKLNPIPKH